MACSSGGSFVESLRRQGRLAADRADVAAVATAAVWLVHPLATQAVSYLYQRIELMAALAALGTLAAAMAARGSRQPVALAGPLGGLLCRRHGL
jgi:hypothetical protein